MEDKTNDDRRRHRMLPCCILMSKECSESDVQRCLGNIRE